MVHCNNPENFVWKSLVILVMYGGHRGRDHMVVGFITTY